MRPLGALAFALLAGLAAWFAVANRNAVIFSLDALKKAHPMFARYYKNVVKAEKTGDREVTFTFDVKGNRELPAIVGEMARCDNITTFAREHDIRTSLLYTWRRELRYALQAGQPTA